MLLYPPLQLSVSEKLKESYSKYARVKAGNIVTEKITMERSMRITHVHDFFIEN